MVLLIMITEDLQHTCSCGKLIPLTDIRCEECAVAVDCEGNEWFMGTEHVCTGCPGAEECEYAFGEDLMDGLCPADHAEQR